MQKIVILGVVLLALTTVTFGPMGCSGGSNSEEPNSGPPPDPDAGSDVELPH